MRINQVSKGAKGEAMSTSRATKPLCPSPCTAVLGRRRGRRTFPSSIIFRMCAAMRTVAGDPHRTLHASSHKLTQASSSFSCSSPQTLQLPSTRSWSGIGNSASQTLNKERLILAAATMAPKGSVTSFLVNFQISCESITLSSLDALFSGIDN